MEILKEMLSIGGAIASILSFALGFFAGAPIWQKRGVRLAQKQSQNQKAGRAGQSQEQQITF